LTPRQWESLLVQLGPEAVKLVELKRSGLDDRAIAQSLGVGASQVQKLWFKLLEAAWEIRNRTESGARKGTDE
jgi:transposase